MPHLDIPHPDLLTQIETYRLRHGISRSQFGLDAINDPNLYGDLKKGRELRSATLRRVQAHLIADPKPKATGPQT